MSAMLGRLMLDQQGRYVDYDFGFDVPEVEMIGGRCADFLFSVIGLSLDTEKAEDDRCSIIILGARPRVDHRLRAIFTKVSDDEAEK